MMQKTHLHSARDDRTPAAILHRTGVGVPRTWSLASLCAVLLLGASTAWSQARVAPGPSSAPNGMTWGELALLPEYCPDTMGILYGDQYFNASPRAAGWVAQLGQGFWAHAPLLSCDPLHTPG